MRRAEADRGTDRKLLRRHSPLELADLFHEPRRNRLDQIERRAGDNHHEFVSTVTADQVLRPRAALEQRTDVAQDAVADKVSERVVDCLEIVEIEQNDAHRRALSKKFLRLRHDEAAIEDAGQLVARGESVKIADDLIERMLTGDQASRADERRDDRELRRRLLQEVVVAGGQCRKLPLRILNRSHENGVHVPRDVIGAHLGDHFQRIEILRVRVDDQQVVPRVRQHRRGACGVDSGVGEKPEFF